MPEHDRICYCPYCFTKFHSDFALFKAETYYTAQDGIKDSTDERYKYLEHEDKRFNDFWRRYPGGIKVGNDDMDSDHHYDGWNHATLGITEYANEKMLAAMTDEEKKDVPIKIDESSLSRDAEGFIYKVRDTMGESTQNRICPHCHNQLPYEFGKYPIKYIAVVGITRSGKTVYLSQLMKHIDEYMTRMNLTVITSHYEIDRFVKWHPLRRNCKLPNSTNPEVLTPPMVINVKHNVDGRRFTIVFFDIAGENCVDRQAMEEYGKFVVCADAIIMLVDPSQMVDITNQHTSDEVITQPQRVAQAMQECFIASQNVGGKTSIPLAATISKSDLLKTVLPEHSRVFRNIEYSEYKEPFGFAEYDALLINHELQTMITGGRNLAGIGFKNVLDQSFGKYSFFAVSGLNCDIKGNELLSEPEPLRIEEPLAWILNKLGIVSSLERQGVQQRRRQLFRLFGR